MAPTKSRAGGKNGKDQDFRIRFQGAKGAETLPEIDITLWTRGGEEIARIPVAEDGKADVSAATLNRAEIVRLGPRGGDLDCLREVGLSLRASDFASRLQQGPFDVGRTVWEGWVLLFTCVSGRLRVCRPGSWWFDDLTSLAREPVTDRQRIGSVSLRERGLAPASLDAAIDTAQIASPTAARRIPPANSIDELIAWPFRCAPICEARIDVYRRTCCCDPWITFDPRLKELICRLEEEIPDLLPPIPAPTIGLIIDDPRGLQTAPGGFFKNGALDRRAVNAAADLRALRSLPPEAIPEYVNARPYLFCPRYDCSDPVKVAEGEPGLDGRFNICWPGFPLPTQPNCHVEYAYRVYQPFGPFFILIYDGVSAGEWFDGDDDPTLTSYSEWAYGCRINPAGNFVFLDVIGDTGAHHLNTPDAASADSVAAPSPTSGTVFPVPSALSAVTDRNWGGNLKISLLISEGMQDIGAKYYRISVVEADASGAPASGATRHALNTVPAWNKAVATATGVDIVPVSLGPNSEDGQNSLFEIPYDTNPTTDWLDNQYHVVLDTKDTRWSDPTVRHLLTVEIFDENGQRLRPTGTPATGLGGAEGEAAFTFRRRYQETGDTAEVPFGALTHMFWWDNREMVADIVDFRQDGLENNDECQFLAGTASSTFGIGYRAYHENPLFHASHNIQWQRGLGNTDFSSGSLANAAPIAPASAPNVGGPPDTTPPGASGTQDFGTLLQTQSRCAFSLWLNVYNKRTDGDDHGFVYQGDTAAVALEITSE